MAGSAERERGRPVIPPTSGGGWRKPRNRLLPPAGQAIISSALLAYSLPREARLMRTTLPVLAALLFPAAAAADDKTGGQLYKQHCARCHGANGQGTAKYPQPLTGDKAVAGLARVIDRTMPEDDPDKLDLAESTRVAEYIHDAFYSPVAQARLNPPRVELARLTVKQYRNSVADLIGSFRPSQKIDDSRPGLRGEYYNARNFRNDKKLIARTDPEINFDFGTYAPEADEKLKEPFDRHQFSIRWEGAVLAPETGEYEFVVRTEHALRLWVNDTKKPLIDGWVKSGDDTEYRAGIFLLGGRYYTVRLEFSKAKQGVDDSKKNPNPPAKKASVALLWKRPHAADEVIPKVREFLAKHPRWRSSRRHSRRTTGASGGNAARPFPRSGRPRRPRPRSRPRGTSRPVCRNSPAPRTATRTAGQSSARSPARSPSGRSAARSRPTRGSCSSTARSTPPRTRTRPSNGSCCSFSSRRGSYIPRPPARTSSSRSPPASRSCSGIRPRTRPCSTPRPPASSAPGTRSPSVAPSSVC